MAVWPAQLRFEAELSSFSSTPQDNVQRTSVDHGPVLARRRFTAVSTEMEFTLPPMTDAEFAVFENFYKVTLADGALSFEAPHPLTGLSGVFRFLAPYSLSPSSRVNFVQVRVEQLP